MRRRQQEDVLSSPLRGSFIVARELDGERVIHRTVQEHTGKCSVLPFLRWSGSFQLWTDGVVTSSSASIFASAFMVAWTSKTFQNTVRYSPSLALFYVCTTDRQNSMLTCHRIASPCRKHIAILSSSVCRVHTSNKGLSRIVKLIVSTSYRL